LSPSESTADTTKPEGAEALALPEASTSTWQPLAEVPAVQ
jgi:hypothetical protein